MIGISIWIGSASNRYRRSLVGPGGVHRVYWGVGVAGIRDAATLEAMSRADQYTYEFTTSGMAPNNQKAYVAFPATWTMLLVTLDDFEVDLSEVATVQLHDANASLIDYKLYETTNLLTTIAMAFAVTFLVGD